MTITSVYPFEQLADSGTGILLIIPSAKRSFREHVVFTSVCFSVRNVLVTP